MEEVIAEDLERLNKADEDAAAENEDDENEDDHEEEEDGTAEEEAKPEETPQKEGETATPADEKKAEGESEAEGEKKEGEDGEKKEGGNTEQNGEIAVLPDGTIMLAVPGSDDGSDDGEDVNPTEWVDVLKPSTEEVVLGLRVYTQTQDPAVIVGRMQVAPELTIEF